MCGGLGRACGTTPCTGAAVGTRPHTTWAGIDREMGRLWYDGRAGVEGKAFPQPNKTQSTMGMLQGTTTRTVA